MTLRVRLDANDYAALTTGRTIRKTVAESSDMVEVSLMEAATVEALRAELQRCCPHKHEVTIPEGSTGMLGRVICTDCGREREWNA